MATSPTSGPGGGGLSAPATIAAGASGTTTLDVRAPNDLKPALTLSNDTWDTDPTDPIGQFYAGDDGSLYITAHGSGKVLTITAGGGVIALDATGGGVVYRTLNAAPADALLNAGDLALWLDATNGAAKLMVKAKQADGTVRTAAVALA